MYMSVQQVTFWYWFRVVIKAVIVLSYYGYY